MKKLLTILGILTIHAYAQGTNNSAPVNYLAPTVAAIKNTKESSSLTQAKPSGTLPPTLSNLNSIDDSADDLQKKRRILETEKLNAEIKRARNPDISSASGTPAVSIETAQTTVTGVAINQEGKKIAWLQFADGGSLTVNLGSKVGKYEVTDITMSGVELSYLTGKKSKPKKTVFLKRAYYSAEKSKNQSTTNNSPFYNPSPVVTSANTSNSNEMVPPIETK